MSADNWNSKLYDQRHSFVYEYGKDLIALLNPQPGERILDAGCGTGHLTKQIAESGATVIGMDSSANMIETARREYPDIQFLPGDVTDFSFPEPFDAIFSNATLHWVARAEVAIRCMSRALRSGGRFVVEFGGRGNVANILDALDEAMRELGLGAFVNSWYYPSIGEYTPLLEKHGLVADAAWLFDRPTKLEGEDGMLNWLRMFGTVKTQSLGDEDRRRAFDLAVEKVRSRQYVDGQWYADYRRLRVVAHRE
ncbi:MAG TPA: methyltransferase domain-containing protein [Blastocatellia bacterium]|nr:methyltransferase domain-containing protein [Blastocatellia bacterium]